MYAMIKHSLIHTKLLLSAKYDKKYFKISLTIPVFINRVNLLKSIICSGVLHICEAALYTASFTT